MLNHLSTMKPRTYHGICYLSRNTYSSGYPIIPATGL
jgi:hypothetical protein